jgi:hypothetical protein
VKKRYKAADIMQHTIFYRLVKASTSVEWMEEVRAMTTLSGFQRYRYNKQFDKVKVSWSGNM